MKPNRHLWWLIIIILIIIGIIVYGLWRANHRGPRFMADSELVLPDGSQVLAGTISAGNSNERYAFPP